MLKQVSQNFGWVAPSVRENYKGSRSWEELVEEQFLQQLLTQLDAHALHVRMEREEKGFTIVDVRAAEDYAKGHIPGAISMTASEINSRYRELADKPEIILYCYSLT